MPSSDDRFYLLEMSNRPVKYGDIGSLVRIEGVLIGGGGAHQLCVLPGTDVSGIWATHELSIEEWSDFIRRSDDPEILVGPKPNGSQATLPKIFQRKLRWEISGAVQQKVWTADGFMCVYCHRRMGDVLMTVDHFVPLELGGKNDVTNYLAACKPCNKSKGSQHPEQWLKAMGEKVFGRNAEWFFHYLSNRKV